MTPFIDTQMNIHRNAFGLSDPAEEVAAALVTRYPGLTELVGKALAIVRAGGVTEFPGVPDGYLVDDPVYIQEAVLVRTGFFYCGCPQAENGRAGWYPPYPPRVRLGIWKGPACVHVLAVYIGLMAQDESIPFNGELMYPPDSIGESGI